MTNRTFHTDPLAALGAHPAGHGYAIDLTATGLRVRNPEAAGCCAEVAHAADTITCRPRRDDGGTRWFFTSWGDPIAEADRITDAVLFICSILSERSDNGAGQ